MISGINPERAPTRVQMTEEQRTRWRVLSLRERAAQLAGDQVGGVVASLGALAASLCVAAGLVAIYGPTSGRDLSRTRSSPCRPDLLGEACRDRCRAIHPIGLDALPNATQRGSPGRRTAPR